MKFQIKNRWSLKVIFECEAETQKEAVTKALASGANLRDANLSDAYLSDAYLSDTDLRGAYLRGADLSGAYLSGADLSGADLRDANLRGADLRGAYLRGADLSGADLSGANLSDANLSGVPIIKNIHKTVFAAASQPKALNMLNWHTCKTTHCRAGWVTTLAGEGGAALEWAIGTGPAASMIYLASDPGLEKIPDFHCANEEAMADMKRLAEAS